MKSIVLAAALETTEVKPTVRVNPPVVRHVGAVRTPLNLSVIPFRYRIRRGRIEAVRATCRHVNR